MKLMVKARFLSWIFFWVVIVSINGVSLHKVMAESGSEIGLLIIGHGYFSQDQKFYEFVNEVQKRLPEYTVDSGLHMVMDMQTHKMWQTEDEAIRRLESQRVKKVIVIPLYLNTNSSTVNVIKWCIGCQVDGEPGKTNYLEEIVACPDSYDSENNLCMHMGGVHRRFHDFSDIQYIATNAIDYHEDISNVLLERALEFSTDRDNEVVFLIGHGDGDDGIDQDYRDNVLAKYASDVKGMGGFYDVQYGTLREDWCDKKRIAVEEIRNKIIAAHNEGRKVIWVPVRISSWSKVHDQVWDPQDCSIQGARDKLGTKDLLDAGMYTKANYLLYEPASLADWAVSLFEETVKRDQYIDCQNDK